MSTSTTTTWESLPGQTVKGAGTADKSFWLDLEGGRVSFRARHADMGLTVEKPAEDEMTEDVTDFAPYAGQAIASVNVTLLAPDHGERSRVTLTFANGEKLLLRAEISTIPVVIA